MSKLKKSVFKEMWFWLMIISILLVMLIILKIHCLYKLNFVPTISLGDFFSDENGRFSSSLFWSALGTVGSISVAVCSYRLSKKLCQIESEKYELETQPFIMINKASKIETVALNENGKHIGFKDVKTPYFNDRESDTVSASQCDALILEINNVSKNFCRVTIKKMEIKSSEGVTIEFNGSTTNIDNNKLSLKSDEKSQIYFITARKLSLKNSECSLTVILHNSFGNAYKQKIDFYILYETDDVLTIGEKSYSKPERIEIESKN